MSEIKKFFSIVLILILCFIAILYIKKSINSEQEIKKEDSTQVTNVSANYEKVNGY